MENEVKKETKDRTDTQKLRETFKKVAARKMGVNNDKRFGRWVDSHIVFG